MTMTEREMLRFESIFDLLTRLGFKEDQENERMVAPKGQVHVAFEQIGGRTVAEFVRWGIKDGLLLRYLTETPQMPVIPVIKVRPLGEPWLNLVRLPPP